MVKFGDINIGDVVTICCEKGDCDKCKMINASARFVVIGKIATTADLSDGIVKLDYGGNTGRDITVKANEICKMYDTED